MILKYTYYIALIFLCFVFRIDTAEKPSCGSSGGAGQLLLFLGKKAEAALTPAQNGKNLPVSRLALWTSGVRAGMVVSKSRDSTMEQGFAALQVGLQPKTRFTSLADQVLKTEPVIGTIQATAKRLNHEGSSVTHPAHHLGADKWTQTNFDSKAAKEAEEARALSASSASASSASAAEPARRSPAKRPASIKTGGGDKKR